MLQCIECAYKYKKKRKKPALGLFTQTIHVHERNVTSNTLSYHNML